MAIIGGFVGGGVEMVPAGKGQLCCQWLTPDRQNLADAKFEVASTEDGPVLYTANARADGRAEILVPVGTYWVRAIHNGEYDADGPQMIIVESTQSYMIYFGVQMAGVSVVRFEGGPYIATAEYEIKDTAGNLYYSGSTWYATPSFILPYGSYTLKLGSNTTSFSVGADGVTTVDISEWFCTVTIDQSNIPVGTTAKLDGNQGFDMDQPLILVKDGSSHSISYTAPSYSNGTAVATIAATSFQTNASQITLAPVGVGVYTYATESGDFTVPKGRYHIRAIGGGGGGGSGRSYSSGRISGGGGGSGRVEEGDFSLEQSTHHVTIGAGGNLGANGGATSFGTIISASGGGHGQAYASSDTGSCGGDGAAGGGGGGGGYYRGHGRTGGKGYTYGGGGGGYDPDLDSSNFGGAGGAQGGSGGRGSYGENSATTGRSGKTSNDPVFGTHSANGGGANSGGGGGGGHNADGGAGYMGGGGGGGAFGGNGGRGGSPGLGFGAGGCGDGEDSGGDDVGGGGAGGFGNNQIAHKTTGGAGLVTFQWVARS